MNFRKINNLAGWITGGIATLVYLLTMERTTSFWDCGEFLSCANKLEVGHSPGAPLFMMLQRMFGLLAGGDKAHIALMINAFSAVMSGGTILFLFWTITHMSRRLVLRPASRVALQPLGTWSENLVPTTRQTIAIIGAGLVGALAYTFSDTFWFSAVEAEVYATSSFFTALVVWAILKWEAVADRPYADRWLLFIMYMMGLSIGIHLLNLLTIPALAMVYYFRRYNPTIPGAVAAFFIGGIILGLVQFGVIQYVPIFAFALDRLFVNSFGLPFFSGAIFAIVLLAIGLFFAIRWAHKSNRYLLHLGLLSLVFVLIGFSSYVVPVIRSRADTAIDMTDPSNMPNLLSYVQREQFGEQPILSGPYFTDRLVAIDSKGDSYAPTQQNGKDHYEVIGRKLDYKFENYHFFSRIWDSNDPNHVNFYKQYLGLGEGDEPDAADNMRFFMGYQMNWMWWRYLMWNYAGRQNDFEGQGEAKNGNWISGIGFVDKALGRGDINKMANGYRNNEARNQLYFLPLILGFMGLVYQYRRSKRQLAVVATLFFFTGIAIGIYLNMPPLQPRERDYAFAGSTYAFAIWIGMGVLMLDEMLRRFMPNGNGSAAAATAIALLAVPVLMANVEWKDHDRSNKTLARASAYNTLMSCEKNAILFTFGDNDTYPLWYLQEVENVRPDIRVVNTSLLGIYWYINQLNYKINEADAIPMIWKPEDYTGDNRNYLRHITSKMYPGAVSIPDNTFIPLEEVCRFILDKNNQLPVGDADGEMTNYFPTKNFFVPSPDKARLIASGMLKATDTADYSTTMQFTFPKETFVKDDIAVLNIVAGVAKEGWKRPIYFGGGLGDNYQGMDDYLKLEGTVYRLMPYKKITDPRQPRNPQDMGFVDLDKSMALYKNLYTYGGGERNDVYFDEKNKQMFMQYRINAARIADELSTANRKADAIAVLDKVRLGITEHSYSYDYTAFFMAQAYYHAGAMQQARDMSKKIENNITDDINWILTLSEGGKASMLQDAQRDMQILNGLAIAAKSANDTQTATALDAKLKQLGDRIMQNIPMEGS